MNPNDTSVHVDHCNEVVIIEDEGAHCLEIHLGSVRIIIFGDGQTPVIRLEKEGE